MPESAGPDSSTSLEGRIEAAKRGLQEEERPRDPMSAMHSAWRMVIDLVAGVGLGAVFGYGLDILFGTLPVFLAAMTLLGFAAGVKLMLRTAREVQGEVPGKESPRR